MDLSTHIFGISISEFSMLIAEWLILFAIILEGPFYQRKRKEVEKQWRKFMRDTKRYWAKKEEALKSE